MDAARFHQAAGSEPEPELAAEADDPEPNIPPDIDIWSVILSFKESVYLFLQYLWCKLHLRVRNNEVGSRHITFECSSLQVLEGLWEDYRSGHLNSVAQELLITPQVLKKLGLTKLKLKTFISGDQYEKGKKLLEASSGDYCKFEVQAFLQFLLIRHNKVHFTVKEIWTVNCK